MNINEESVLDVIQRWEATGLLYGLPMWEKEELAPLYDDSARLLLSKKAAEKIPNDTYETLNGVIFPVVRRMYRRVGINFDIENMMVLLIDEVEKYKVELNKPATPDNNPIVAFCVEFADNYEDEKTSEKRFSDEEYVERVEKILNKTREVLLSKKMVSFVDRTETDWKMVFSDKKKSTHQTRVWNQKVAQELLRTTLMDTNKGI